MPVEKLSQAELLKRVFEMDEQGTSVQNIPVGGEFYTITAMTVNSSQVKDDEISGVSRWVEAIGTIVHKGVGSVTVALTGKNDHITWAPETKVIRL